MEQPTEVVILHNSESALQHYFNCCPNRKCWWNQLKIITQDETLFTLVNEQFTEFDCEWTMV